MIIKSKLDLANYYDLISTSYHESGHAIYGLLHHIKINSIYVFEHKKYKRIGGFCQYGSAKDLSDIKDQLLFSTQLESEICIKYAGLYAEKYHYKNISGSDKFPLFLKDGSSEDILSAAALIKQYNIVPAGKKRYSYKQKLIKNTLTELQINWDAVSIVAHSLFRKKRLNYIDIKKLLTRKSKNKEFWKNQFKEIDLIFKDSPAIDEITLKSILIG